MTNPLRFLFVSQAPVNRRTYLATGAGLALLKYIVDAALIELGAGQPWLPTDYIRASPLSFSWPVGHADYAGRWLLPVLLVWTLPFIFIGVTMTARRARDAGWSEWWCGLFFVPYLNYVVMAVFSSVPSAAAATSAPPAEGEPSTQPGPRSADAVLAGVTGVVIGIAIGWFSVAVGHSYGAALFTGAPFSMGACTAFIFNRRHPATVAETGGLVATVLASSAVVFLLTGFEGAGCLIMSLPITIPIALLGAQIGRAVAGGGGHDAKPVGIGLILLPVWILIEPAGSTGQQLHEVRSSIEIAAAPELVWPRVIAFDPLPAPTEPIFRLGIAAPERAHIDGAGVGAIRYCEFSTGAFVEPITRWEPGRRLSFDVTSSPPPMREWSPYADLHPPHLDGYLRSRRGEFRLIALEGGRTRLEGSTWYELQMGPEAYWQVFSDYLIHRIHMRVLEHIKLEAERGNR